MKQPILLGLMAAAVLTPGPSVGAPPGAAGVIAFWHLDSGSLGSPQQTISLRVMDPQNPAQQSTIRQATGTLIVGPPVWSKDHRQLAFSANANPLGSLEAQSVLAINPDGTGLRRITGFGTLETLPGPTGVVVGRVVAPDLSSGRQIPGSVVGCVISAEGSAETADCDTNGSFELKNVPAGAHWVRAQGEVSYEDPLGVVPTGGPGLSFGFAAVTVRPGQVTDVGTIVVDPMIGKSIEPSWSRDGTQLVVTNEVSATTLQENRDTHRFEWKPATSQRLRVWSANGELVRAVTLPGFPQADMKGADWSPTADLLACGAGSNDLGAFVLVLNPDGTGAQAIYRAPSDLNVLRLVTQCRWSPDGRRIAFTQSATLVDFSAAWSDLFVVNADGSGLRQLTQASPGHFALSPTWSPDGQSLAFDGLSTSGTSFQRSDLFTIDPDGTGLKPLTMDGLSFYPAW